MKRSEMELYIEQIIIEHQGYKDTNCVLANNILRGVEEAGMLPPLTDKLINGKGYGWEPEND